MLFPMNEWEDLKILVPLGIKEKNYSAFRN